MVEEVGIGNAIDRRIHCDGEAKHGGDVFKAAFVRQYSRSEALQPTEL